MEHSAAFEYVKNQYVMGKFTPANLITLVSRKIITDEERNEILTMMGAV